MQSWTDSEISLSGVSNIIGKGLVIERNGNIIECATIMNEKAGNPSNPSDLEGSYALVRHRTGVILPVISLLMYLLL